MPVQTFRRFVTEAAAASAQQWEVAIVIAFNGGWNRARETYGLPADTYRQMAPVATRIASSIRSHIGLRGRDHMLHFGTGAGQTVRTIEWWTGKNTPKTDCYTSSGVRISLKKQGGSQLMSGLAQETLSTFTAATRYMSMTPASSAHAEQLVQLILPVMSQRVQAGQYTIDAITAVAADIKAYAALSAADKQALKDTFGIATPEDLRQLIGDTLPVKGRPDQPLTDADKRAIYQRAVALVNLESHLRHLTPVVANWFEQHPDFKLWFTYEAATGAMKFTPTPTAAANWLVEFDPVTGQQNRIHPLTVTAGPRPTPYGQPSTYVEDLAATTTFRLSFKTSTGAGRGGVTSPSLRTADLFRAEAAGDGTPEAPILAFARDVWGELTGDVHPLTEDLGETVGGILRAVVRRLRAWWDRVVRHLRDLAARGLAVLLAFLGFQPDRVDVTGLDRFFAQE